MAIGNTALTLQQAENFTVDDLYELQGRGARFKPSAVSIEQRRSLKASLGGKSSAAAGAHRSVQQIAQNLAELASFLSGARQGNFSFLGYSFWGKVSGSDVTAGRQRMLRLKSVSGLNSGQLPEADS